jgi:FAD synthetase
MVFGTFDVLHKGHEHFFQQARGLANPAEPFLIVSVARDKNVARIKGRRTRHGEKQRLRAVGSHKLVDRAVLGALGDHLPHIIRQRPAIIALGYDQKEYVRGLKTALRQRGLNVKIVRLKAHKPEKYKSSLMGSQSKRKV